MALHQLNRTRLCERLKQNAKIPSSAFVVLQGGGEFNRYCSDVQVAPFRQVSLAAAELRVIQVNTVKGFIL